MMTIREIHYDNIDEALAGVRAADVLDLGVKLRNYDEIDETPTADGAISTAVERWKGRHHR